MRRGTTMPSVTALLRLLVLSLPAALALCGEPPAAPREVKDLAYHAAAGDAAMQERCRINLSLPATGTGFPTLVWFHGGGLTGGSRGAPEGLATRGIAVAAAGYRLSPTVACPVYIEDAAAATAWVLEHIGEYGGDPAKVFIGGYSAGAYLSTMVVMDPAYLARHGRKPMDLAGLCPVSGQMTTHFTVLGERKLPKEVPVVDAFAPVAHARAELPPILLITGAAGLDIPCRVEENRWFAAVLRQTGHQRVEMHELGGFDHSTCVAGATPLIRGFINGLAQGQAARPRRFVGVPQAGRSFAFGEEADWTATGGTRAGAADLDAALQLSWRPDGLRLLVTVTDDAHNPPTAIAQGWRSDSVMIAFQSSAGEGSRLYSEVVLAEVAGRAELFCTAAQHLRPAADPASILLASETPVEGAAAAAAAATVERNGTTVRYALTIPAAWLGQRGLAAGDGLALAVAVNDHDGARRKGYLHWGGGVGGANVPRLFNIVALEP